jgi:hypothetical protein
MTLTVVNYSPHRKFGGLTSDNYIHGIWNICIACIYRIYLSGSLCVYFFIEQFVWDY